MWPVWMTRNKWPVSLENMGQWVQGIENKNVIKRWRRLKDEKNRENEREVPGTTLRRPLSGDSRGSSPRASRVDFRGIFHPPPWAHNMIFSASVFLLLLMSVLATREKNIFEYLNGFWSSSEGKIISARKIAIKRCTEGEKSRGERDK